MSNESEPEVRVSYLSMTAPSLWGSVGSLVFEPGGGRYAILRRLRPDGEGPEGYLVVDLVACVLHLVPGTLAPFATERDARAAVVGLCARDARDAAG